MLIFIYVSKHIEAHKLLKSQQDFRFYSHSVCNAMYASKYCGTR